MELIKLSSVYIRRGGKPVLSNINWTTQTGEHWFIMGANGSGKTTLTEILMGYLWPQKGTVSVLGQTFGRTNLPELRKRVGYVAPWIFKRMPNETLVEDVVASGSDSSVGAYGRKSPALKKRIASLLKFFDANRLAGQKFGEISSGQQLKVILCRALIHQPALLILDEPFSLLDFGARISMYQYLEKLASAKRAPQIILVTHHKEDIVPLVTHGLILKDGKIVSQGNRTDVLTPSNLARSFLVSESDVKKYFV